MEWIVIYDIDYDIKLFQISFFDRPTNGEIFYILTFM